jgi:IclR family transcriptional regulator, pca regulon regulatory protein
LSEDGELEVGLRSFAAPVRDRSGAVVAAVGISTSATAGPVADAVGRLVPALRSTAAAAGDDLRVS